MRLSKMPNHERMIIEGFRELLGVKKMSRRLSNFDIKMVAYLIGSVSLLIGVCQMVKSALLYYNFYFCDLSWFCNHSDFYLFLNATFYAIPLIIVSILLMLGAKQQNLIFILCFAVFHAFYVVICFLSIFFGNMISGSINAFFSYHFAFFGFSISCSLEEKNNLESSSETEMLV